MAGVWTADKILALAPDPASAKSGRDLANARKWKTLGQNDRAVWGECQGSGKDPYRTQIDPNEPAFKCSCPSRKFPCKHALGLFLLTDSAPAAFKDKDAPQWVGDWLATRAEKKEKKAAKAEAAESDPAEQARRAAEQAKRGAQRAAKVAEGLAELELWLHDLVRLGLATAQTQPGSFWENTARRMVDAQAPGVARRVREMAGLPAGGEGWAGRLLERIAKVHLLAEGYKRLDSLPEPTRADVRGGLGFTQSLDDLKSQPGVRDLWEVLAQRSEEEDDLRTQRTWLRARSTGRPALVLAFAHRQAAAVALDSGLVAGTVVDAEVVYFPGAMPLRAVVKSREGPPVRLDAIGGHATLTEGVAAFGRALALNPWIERWPMPLTAVTPRREAAGDRERWVVADAEGRALPLSPAFAAGWRLLALGGGGPIALFGEWDGDHLLPLSASADGRFVGLG